MSCLFDLRAPVLRAWWMRMMRPGVMRKRAGVGIGKCAAAQAPRDRMAAPRAAWSVQWLMVWGRSLRMGSA